MPLAKDTSTQPVVLDRSNIGFAKQTYQIDTGVSNEAYA
ncbi:hypothetical protein OSJ98_15545, partial [Escherichia coli]|nr:hypothetical protein [Escherichia coli]